MSLSLLTSLHCFPSFTSISSSSHQNSLLIISKSRPRPIISNRAPLLCSLNSKQTQFDQTEHHSATPRRTALIALSVLITGFSATLSSQTLMASASMLPEFGPQPRPLDSVIRVLVPRPPKPQNREDVEVLVVNGIEVKNNKAVKFDVYIDKVDRDGENSSDSSELGELAGSLVDLARLQGGRKLGRLNLCIDWVLEKIGAEESEKLLVSLVPRMGSDIVIDGINIEYLKAA